MSDKIRTLVEKNKPLSAGIIILILIGIMYLSFGKSSDVMIDDSKDDNKYNLELPYDEKELSETDKNTAFKEHYNDSVMKVSRRNKGMGNEEKSLEDFEKELEDFSFEENKGAPVPQQVGRGGSNALYQDAGAAQNNEALLALEREKEEKARLAEEEAMRKKQWKEEQSQMDGFFDTALANDVVAVDTTTKNTGYSDPVIKASLKGDHTVYDGMRVTFWTSQDATLNGTLYPKNTLVFGIVDIKKNRAHFSVKKINHKNVDVTIYDSYDGLEGLYLEGKNIAAETANEGVQELLQDQAINDVPGGNALKKVLQRKTRVRKVQLLNNAEILIKPNS